MKTLKNGNIAIYRNNSILIFCAIMGWIMALAVIYLVCYQDKKLLSIVIPIISVMGAIQVAFLLKILSRPAFEVFPQGIKLYTQLFNPVTVFWNQVTAIFVEKKNDFLTFETNEKTPHQLSLMRISKEDRQFLFQVLKEHNLSVQEHCS